MRTRGTSGVVSVLKRWPRLGGSARSSDRLAVTQDLAYLDTQSAHALVEADNCVLTSEQELGFAVARFGENAAAPFLGAVNAAKAQLAVAFEIRLQLEDGSHRTGSARRSMLNRIIAHCDEVSRLLDEQAEAFDRFQKLQDRATRVLAEVDAHTAQQTYRIGRSSQILARLASKYTPQSITTVESSPAEATERLDFAAICLDDAKQELAADDAASAAVLLQAAEAAADQASDLLDGVGHLEAELTQAMSALPAALREIDAEIADAAELTEHQADAEQTGLVPMALATAAAVRSQLNHGPVDALTALRSLEQADSALDQILAPARGEYERQDRALAVLDEAMLAARSSVTTATDFITTRRGGIDAPARTRLHEAARHFEQAIAHVQPDPEAALAQAQEADGLARQARALADQDVSKARAGTNGKQSAADCAVNGAILGGILIEADMDSVQGHGAREGGQTSPALGPDSRFGPGSFGGVGTRTRSRLGGTLQAAASPEQTFISP